MYNLNIIKANIILKNKTIKEVADEIGINENTISNWINDRNTENISNFIELIQYLNIDIRDIKKKNTD